MKVKSESEVAQSCPTLCHPIDGSPPGSPVPGILQARTLEWVAISFSNAWKWKVKVKSVSRVWLLATPWTAAYQAPPSMVFSRQEYWSGGHCLLPSQWGLGFNIWIWEEHRHSVHNAVGQQTVTTLLQDSAGIQNPVINYAITNTRSLEDHLLWQIIFSLWSFNIFFQSLSLDSEINFICIIQITSNIFWKLLILQSSKYVLYSQPFQISFKWTFFLLCNQLSIPCDQYTFFLHLLWSVISIFNSLAQFLPSS